MPIPDAASYPFDLELISATPENFDFQMAYLRKHLNPVPLSSIVGHFVNGTTLPDRAVVVTFDDGYDDNLHYAGPVLQRHGIVPTVFVATDYVGANVPYWFELAVYLMMRLPVGSMQFEGLSVPLPTEESWQQRRRCASVLQQAMKHLSKSEIERLVRQWNLEFSSYINPDEYSLSRCLSWSDLRSMDGNGFEIGSHSMSHPVLSKLDETTLRAELEGSKRKLELELGHPITTLAYPIGKDFAYTSLVQQVARDSGYDLAAAYNPGVNWVGRGVDRFALRRQSIEREHDSVRFQGLVEFPDWVQW